MPQLGKIIIIFGIILIVVGATVWILGRTGFRGLPGDISYESDNVKVYFPWVTCLVISVVLTLAMWIWQWFNRL